MNRSWSLVLGHEPGALVWILLVACVGAAVFEAVWTLRKRARAGTAPGLAAVVGLLLLRALGLAALVAVVLELGVRVETWTGSARRLVVLVDHSASLDLADSPASADPGEDSERRWDRLERLWTEGAEAREGWRRAPDAATAGSVDVEVRAYAGTTLPLTQRDADSLALEPDGAASRLSAALAEIAAAEVGEGAPLAGLLVLSDGLVVPPDGAAELEHLAAIVDELGVPLSAVALGAPTLRDLAIAELHVGEFAFVENVTEFSAEFVAHGLEGERAEVELLRDGEVVDSRELRLGADGDQPKVSFEIAPDRTGQFVYGFRARVLPRAGGEVLQEASLTNNARSFVIKILRDKVRVLHVAGRPDWDVRALRTLLKRDPNVELLSYYILRDWEDTVRDDGTAPLSLIAFPTDELFREQLGSFDLIILHNFDAVSHDTYLGNVADYVREGGSLVIIGGDMGMATGDYVEPALRKLLPVDLGVPTGLERDPFSPTVTDAGRRHPITAWLAEAKRTDWSGLPALDSFNPADYPRNASEIGATALLVHPTKKTGDGRPTPLLAVAEPERGRVMTLATGATWRLGFAPDLPLINGARPYDLLWLGAVRWLLRDASAERLLLELDGVEHAVGDSVELSVRTLSPSYAAEPEVEVEYRVTRLDADLGQGSGQDPGKDSGDSRGRTVSAGELVTDGLGRAAVRVTELPAGAYQVRAWRADDPPERGDQDSDAPELGQAARRVFLIGGGGPELAHVDADPGTALLRDLAERSGGVFLEAVDGDALPDRLPLAELDSLDRPADGRRDVPLWDGWAVLVLALAALGGEWIIRRRLGFQ